MNLRRTLPRTGTGRESAAMGRAPLTAARPHFRPVGRLPGESGTGDRRADPDQREREGDRRAPAPPPPSWHSILRLPGVRGRLSRKEHQLSVAVKRRACLFGFRAHATSEGTGRETGRRRGRASVDEGERPQAGPSPTLFLRPESSFLPRAAQCRPPGHPPEATRLRTGVTAKTTSHVAIRWASPELPA